jgi:Uma2 family endonuclease
MAVEISRKHFTVEEYEKMIEAGILEEDDRVELIDGEIIEMGPIGSHHVACVTRLNMLLARLADQDFIVSIQNPIQLNDDSQPQPDIALLKFRGDFYSTQLPRPADIPWLRRLPTPQSNTTGSSRFRAMPGMVFLKYGW